MSWSRRFDEPIELPDGGLYSDRRYDRFSAFAGRAVVYAQITARLLRLDPGQYQRPATSGAGWPEVIDELKIKRVCHGTDQPAPFRRNSESIQRAVTFNPDRKDTHWEKRKLKRDE